MQAGRRLSCKTVQNILEARSSGSFPIANGIGNLLIFNPLHDLHDPTVLACHMQPVRKDPERYGNRMPGCYVDDHASV